MNKILIKNTIKLVIGVMAIGLLHEYELVLTTLLILKLIHSFYKSVKKEYFSPIFLFGFLLTGSIGLLCEFLGTRYGYWEYHDINHDVPYWVFFGWGAAFIVMYQIEKELFKEAEHLSEKSRKYFILFMAGFFPTLGEIIAINLGTWTYYVPFQILGIPIAAIAALIIIHSFVNSFLGFTSKKLGIKDVVFNPQLSNK